MSKEEITKEILSILGNFKLSENIQIKELVSLYMKKQQEIERLNNIIKEAREYIKQTGQYLEDTKRFKVEVLEPNCLDILEILDKENK